MEMNENERWGHHSSWLKKAIGLALILVALVWVAKSLKEYKYIGSNPNETHTISVTGEGKVFIRADVATVQVSITSDAGPTDLSEAQAKNSSRANGIIQFAKSQGLKETDIKTLNYSIYPRYNYSQNGQEFLGYSIRQDIQFKIRDLNKVGRVLNGAVTSGANEVSNLQFTVDDPKKPSGDARAAAIKDAKDKAQKLASDLGVRLVRITSYSESGSTPPPIFYGEAAGKGGGPVPSIQPGQNEVDSNVAITYEIE
ncbi:MAG: SIMPL domain-containing protein [Candidatus Sungbacteria bacterium]|uniref:SIMPL domain-containing protein n=1 Tax=Candidatus Sungiibacteriota bacterium TaxID=2750080 RepID=A0A9D6LQI8_9BACT|nr:SIMPL domain-containing protein [Candidatus Sungbacteria bacterium]